MKVGIYARVSSEAQRDNTSIDTQHSLPPLWTDFRLVRRNRYAA